MIYLLPGRGRALHEGLGLALTQRGFDVKGRAYLGSFSQLTFTEQIALIQSDLESEFWTPDAKIIAVSYGAYLYLNAQIYMRPFVGKVLLLSPVVGEVVNLTLGRYFIPPSADKIKQATATSQFPLPASLEIHVGEEDWQSPLEQVKDLSAKWGTKLNIVNSAGHTLPKDYVSSVLDKFL